ncbi:hypothetical protein Y032_0548g3279 [Ancylostoma ceylanicum]|uniref:Uncharacterized protein n=1 Tax=Ancylostoma ceylanicum TaxID=53326 RepID=A0A016WSI5_9BILA|nr:hypothetical protein Y032_0548g3279 [Ancylostoma ceylanicum]
MFWASTGGVKRYAWKSSGDGVSRLANREIDQSWNPTAPPYPEACVIEITRDKRVNNTQIYPWLTNESTSLTF